MRLQPAVDENLNLHRTNAARLRVPVNDAPRGRISIVCLTTCLGVGGAEMMLYKLLSRIDRTRFLPQVISLRELLPLSDKFHTLGIPVRSLGMHPGRPNPVHLLRLARWLRQDRPNVISTWMYHADLLGGLAAKLAGGIPVAWGIRQSNLSEYGSRRLTIHTMRMCAQMSRWLPARIVCGSEAAQRVHTALGYASEKMIVIPNGFDLRAFKPDLAARESVRDELQIPAGAPLIGLVGRFDPQKDHRNFVCAGALLQRARPDVHFLLCGEEITWENTQLRRWIEEAGIRKQCRLVGRRQDMPRLTAALDIAASSSSFGEGFPNVIGEAMACGVPCAVTDVGDSALIVGQTGRVVPPHNSKALSRALGELIELGPECRSELGAAGRRRVREHFNLPDIVVRYQNLFQELAEKAQVSSALHVSAS
jgi:glycosyltransferase involved in cell wall biosynthesis